MLLSQPISMNGNTMLKDPETGMIYTSRSGGLTIARKKKFLEIAAKYYPDITAICQIVGISKNAYRAHFNLDPVFREKMLSFEEGITDKIEARLASYAMEKSNFMDRIAWLRAHRGEKYNEKKLVQVDVTLTKEKLESKKSTLLGAVDAELIPTDSIVQLEQPMKPAEPK
jgi:hypothetical protein